MYAAAPLPADRQRGFCYNIEQELLPQTVCGDFEFPYNLGAAMILLWLSLLVLFLDRITKMAVVSKMTEGESIPVFENIFHLTYVLNPGAAFGLLPHNRTFFLVIGVVAVFAIWWMRRDILAEGWRVRSGTALFLGGTLGNLWDRIQTGLVIDFLDFRFWPVFNVADIAICVGVGLILWGMVQNGFLKN